MKDKLEMFKEEGIESNSFPEFFCNFLLNKIPKSFFSNLSEEYDLFLIYSFSHELKIFFLKRPKKNLDEGI